MAYPTVPAVPANTAAPIDGQKTTYSAAKSLTLASSATDILTVTGSATKTVRITHIEISGITSAATNAAVDVQLIRRSTANSGGTSATVTAAQHDVNDAAPTAVVTSYTANAASLGTANGTLRVLKYLPALSAQTSTDFPQDNRIIWDFGTHAGERAIVLRGTTDILALNLNAGTITGGVFDMFVVWTEE